MRKVFYIPKGEEVESYKEEWEHKTAEVHTGISPNIKDYVDDESIAQWIDIPEFQHMLGPRTHSSGEYFQIAYINDFDDRKNLPQYHCEVWTKNLDNPSEEQVKTDTWIMQYDVGPNFFHTDHVRLDVGWYDLVVTRDGEEVDSHEISIYESYEEE